MHHDPISIFNGLPGTADEIDLEAPVLNNGLRVTGDTTHVLRRENKHRRKVKQLGQQYEPDWWTEHNGLFSSQVWRSVLRVVIVFLN